MKQPRLFKAVAALAACVCVTLAGGCAATPGGGTAPSEAIVKAAPDSPKFANQLATADSRSPDAAAAADAARVRVVQLDVYQLVIPLGAISRSEEFWKHVEEHRIDVGTYDLLRKNGWRLGIAPTSEWAYFRDIIDAYPASSKPTGLSAGPGGGGSMEMSMKKGVPYQVISYFNDANHLHLRSFEECENLVTIALQQVPRKAGEARITVCPTVRGLRKRFEVSVNRESEREIKYIHPERLYDLNMQVDVPMGHFLVIAPSPEVRWKTSLGATFLVQDGAAEQLENVMLIVPRAAELEQVGAAAPSR